MLGKSLFSTSVGPITFAVIYQVGAHFEALDDGVFVAALTSFSVTLKFQFSVKYAVFEDMHRSFFLQVENILFATLLHIFQLP